MRLHTYTEIIGDVCAFEGVTVKMNEASSPFFQKLNFLKLYSEYYDKPLSGEATVEQLRVRLDEFVSNEKLIVFPFDRSPMEFADEDDEDFVVIYRIVKTRPDGPALDFIEATANRDRVAYYLSAKSDETALAIVYVHDETIQYFDRSTN